MYGTMGNRRDGANWRLIGLIFLVVVGGYLAIKLIGWLLGFLLPVAVIGGLGYVAYRAFGRKALGGGRRTLP